jgi:8-amino-7-oxononanoate synthase
MTLPAPPNAEPGSWTATILEQLQLLRQAHLGRQRRVVERRTPGRVLVDGREYVDFSSNDYLGLAADPRLVRAVREAVERFGWGAAASPLVGGYQQAHRDLEAALAQFERSPSVVVFQSGFAANLGVIPALVGPGDVVFSERRNHASLIDGCRLSKADVELYDGARLDRLADALDRARGRRTRLIVTDSVFSMDGDVAPLRELVEIAQNAGAALYVDEAHATGVLGAGGRGAAEQFGVEDRIDVRIGTLSKALGSVGGFACTSPELAEWIVNRVRPYIFSTNLPPAAAAAALAAIEIAKQPDRRERLQNLADRLRRALVSAGCDVGVSSGTPIIPVLAGAAERAVALADHLMRAGFYAVPIRPPTVPDGTSRVRLSVTAALEESDVDNLVDAIQCWISASGIPHNVGRPA